MEIGIDEKTCYVVKWRTGPTDEWQLMPAQNGQSASAIFQSKVAHADTTHAELKMFGMPIREYTTRFGIRVISRSYRLTR